MYIYNYLRFSSNSHVFFNNTYISLKKKTDNKPNKNRTPLINSYTRPFCKVARVSTTVTWEIPPRNHHLTSRSNQITKRLSWLGLEGRQVHVGGTPPKFTSHISIMLGIFTYIYHKKQPHMIKMTITILQYWHFSKWNGLKSVKHRKLPSRKTDSSPWQLVVGRWNFVLFF